jgi:hypothetical protein
VLLEILGHFRDKYAARLTVCRNLAEHAVAALAKLDEFPPERSWELREIDRAAMLSTLAKCLIAIQS